MTYICYIEKNISDRRMAIIDVANQIVDASEAEGITLTLRAVYYQFVSRFPHVLDPTAEAEGRSPNTQQNYKRLGDILNDGRLAGLVSWDSMEDITRNVIETPNWTGPRAFLDDVPHWFEFDMWDNQPIRPFMWIEKDAQIGTFRGVCQTNRVPLFSCRGNVSQSEMWKAGRGFRELIERGQTPVVLYAGDHDPNGLDMTRDVQKRLSLFAEEEIEVIRILLNMDQIKAFNPPPNPVKNTDSRAAGYRRLMEEGGFDPDECFEMDAMPAREMVALCKAAIGALRNDHLWDLAKDKEADLRGEVRAIIGRGLEDQPEDGDE